MGSTVKLTRRQMEVILLVARDMSDREVASNLGLSVSTVKNHMNQIITRLGVRSRTGAVASLMRLGVIR